MALTENDATRRKQLDAFLKNSGIAAFDGGTAVIDVYSGAPPGANNAATGTKLATFPLPAAPFALAAANASAMTGLPISTTGLAVGTAGYWRLRDATPTYVIEGTVTATGGGGDATIDNTSITVGQTVNLTSFSLGN